MTLAAACIAAASAAAASDPASDAVPVWLDLVRFALADWVWGLSAPSKPATVLPLIGVDMSGGRRGGFRIPRAATMANPPVLV
ncbi:hypothetical protein PBS_26090 [Paraburkholderia sp. 2C]